MSQEIVESIIKLVADNKQALLSFDQLRDAYAKSLQDMDRKQDGHVRHAIGAYRQIADSQLQALSMAAKAKEAEHAKEVKRLNDEIALQKKAAQSRLDSLDAVEKKEKNLQLSRIGRIGAGIATMTGNYQVAGGMYAASNAAQMAGISMSAGATAAVGAGAIGLGILNYGRELNVELAKMSTLLLPASAGTIELSAAMERATESASRLSVRFNTEIVDVVKAYKEALSSGVEEADLERFGKVAGVLAKALGEDFGSAVNILTNFKDTYGATISDLGSFSDVLFNIVDVGKVNTSQLLHNFGRLTPVAKAAGIEIKDLGGAFAALSRQMTVPQATTGLLNMIRVLQNPSEKEKRAMQEYGVMFGQMAFEGRSLVEVVEDIKVKTGGNGAAIAAMFGDVQASRAIQALVTTLDLLKQMPTEMDKAGTAAVAAGRAQDTFWNWYESKIKSVTNAVKIFGSESANALNVAYKFYKDERIGSSAEEYAFKYLQSKGVDAASFEGISGSFRKKLADRSGFYNKDILSGLRAESGPLGHTFTASTVERYLSWLQDQEGKKKDDVEKKDKANKEAIEASNKVLKEEEYKDANIVKQRREDKIKARMSPDAYKDLLGRRADIAKYADDAGVDIRNKHRAAVLHLTDMAERRKFNELRTEEEKALADEVKKRELAVTEYEDQILQQREYKDILKEETLARKQATHMLRKETQDKQQAIRDEIERLREYKADLKDIPARKAGYKYTQTGALINGKPQKIGAWDQGQSAVSYEAQRDAVDARIDVLQKQLYDLGQSVQEVTFQLTNSANGMSTATSAFFAAGQAAINNIANFMTQQTVSVVGANQIDTEKTIDAVRNGLEKAKRNGTNKSNYQKKSTVPTVNTGNGTMISGGKLYQMVNGVWTDPILYEPSGRIDNSR